MIFSRDFRPSKYKLFIKLILPILLIGVIGTIFSIKYWYNNSLKPVDSQSSQEVEFDIEFGDSVNTIATSLQEEGLIRNSTAFNWFVRGEEAGISLQAGNYTLSPSMSVQVIVGVLSEGRIDSDLVTIQSGKRLDETVEEFIAQGWSRAEVEAALNPANYDHPLTNQLPKKATLEGYIYPDSYEINDNTTPEDLVLAALDNFFDKITERGLKSKLSTRGFTIHEGVILASIIHEESGGEDDRAQIAQVFIKRLNENISLGADATFRYAAAVTGQEAAVNIDSPYNTRIHSGLTPGPIANFVIEALEVVADPADGSYLYFVTGDDGVTRFSKTIDEHNALTAKYCIELCKLP